MGFRERVAHVIERAKERYGIVLTEKDVSIMELWIRSGYKVQPSEFPSSPNTKNVKVLWSNIWMTVNVCARRGWIHTVLPANCNRNTGFRLNESAVVRGKKWKGI